MSQIIIGQVLFVLASLFNGMLLMAGYDVLRFFRWLLSHGKIWLLIEDTLYWCLAAIPTFYLFFYYNEGIIRWYGLVGILAGAVLYEVGISLPLRKRLVKYGNWVRRKLRGPWESIKRKWKINQEKRRKKREEEKKQLRKKREEERKLQIIERQRKEEEREKQRRERLRQEELRRKQKIERLEQEEREEKRIREERKKEKNKKGRNKKGRDKRKKQK